MFQLNQLTHWLDNSNIYGSDEKETRRLRKDATRGRLRTRKPSSGLAKDPLPLCEEYLDEDDLPEICEDRRCRKDEAKCTAAGKDINFLQVMTAAGHNI